ncbi:MAG: c-type cytochrome [Planctomycetes bacterium]|nr:c-type cytochrome [Planctomycetota bacterium]
MNRAFALSSIALCATIVWMFWNDYARSWKSHQRTFNTLAYEQSVHEETRIREEVEQKYGPAISKLEQALAEARKEQDANRLNEISQKKESILGAWQQTEMNFKNAKSELDAVKSKYEAAKNDPAMAAEAETWKRRYEEWVTRFLGPDGLSGIKGDFEKIDGEWKGLVAQEEEILSKAKGIEKEIAILKKQIATVERKRSKLAPDVRKDILAAPVVDMLANPLQIQQTMLPGLTEDMNFSVTMRIDRCTTCHLAIDKKGWDTMWNAEKKAWEPVPQPFRSHPNLNLYLSENSPHAVSKFGCTVCHAGSGRSVDFVTAAHTPRDFARAHELEEKLHHEHDPALQAELEKTQTWQWKQKYGWSLPHYFDTPMYPSQHYEAACTKCHSADIRVTEAPRLNRGKELFERQGCFGCHPNAESMDLRQPGPDLRGVKSKVSEAWAYHWVMSPKSFRPTTTMPRLFNLSNTNAPEDQARNQATVQSILHYLFTKSNKARYPEPPAGDAEKGKELLEKVGCLGCHVVGEDADALKNRGTDWTSFGPNLSGVGSKLNPGWIYAWVKDPAQYFPDTRMPNLRLGDEEAADITAYLMTLKQPDWDADPKHQSLPAVDPGVLGRTVLGFLQAKFPATESEAKLKEMNQEQQLLFLGETSIRRQGCFGCHMISGFENEKKIGVELSGSAAIGSKDLAKIDFGFEHQIPHTVQAWLDAKLEDPRRFDRGREIAFEDRLRMPQFDLTPEDRESIVTYLLSLVKEKLPREYMSTTTPDKELVFKARRLIQQSNCAGCHRIGVFPVRIQMPDEDSLDPLASETMWSARHLFLDGREQIAMTPVDESLQMKEFLKAGKLTEALRAGLAERVKGLAERLAGRPGMEKIAEQARTALADIEANDPEKMARSVSSLQTALRTRKSELGPDDLLDSQEMSVLLAKNAFVTYPVMKRLLRNEPPIHSTLVYGYQEGGIAQFLNLEAGDNKAPPLLRGQGKRVQPDWLFRFLKAPVTKEIRPWLEVRMPTFGFTDEEANLLVRYFSLIASEKFVDDGTTDPFPFASPEAIEPARAKEMIAAGENIFQAQQCFKCHPSPGQAMPSNPAPPFEIIGGRIDRDWFLKWVHNSKDFDPNTGMPQFGKPNGALSPEEIREVREFVWSLFKPPVKK